jgi:hypothetical protein
MEDLAKFNFDTSIYTDALTLLCSKSLGSGISRSTFIYSMDSSKVVKIEKPGFFQNTIEMEVWKQVENNYNYSKWFAKCYFLSLNGRILIQERCKDVSSIPDRVPNILADLSIDNWGMTSSGRYVIRDYGVNDIIPRLLYEHKKPILINLEDTDMLKNNGITLKSTLPNGEPI